MPLPLPLLLPLPLPLPLPMPRPIAMPARPAATPLAPRSFCTELQRAQARAAVGHLRLLADEASALPWHADGQRRVATALAGLPLPTAAHPAPAGVLLFAGHRLDAPGRPLPRFPAAQEATARQALRQAIAAWQTRCLSGRPAPSSPPTPSSPSAPPGAPAGTALLGMAGGASGGDILFHEVCADLGVASALYLPMARTPYRPASVQVAPALDSVPGWVARFNALCRSCAAAGRLHQLGRSATLPAWLTPLAGYSIWQRNNRWLLQAALAHGASRLTLLVLWDGQGGDGPGGTQHLVEVARAAGARVQHLDTRALFGLA